MTCYLIHTSTSIVFASTVIDSATRGSYYRHKKYEVKRELAVACMPTYEGPCTDDFIETTRRLCRNRGRWDCENIAPIESDLPCNMEKYWRDFASETWTQIDQFDSPPQGLEFVRNKKVNTNNIVTKEPNKINIKENGNFLGIPGDIAIKTDIPAAEPLAINKVKNVGLFLTQNKTNNTPKFLAFKQMIQELSTTLPEHYSAVIPVPTGNPVLNCEPPTSGNQQCIDGGPTQLTVTVAGIPGDWAALNGSYTFDLPELLRYPPGHNQPGISLNRVVGNVLGYPLLVWLDWGPSAGLLKAKAGLSYDSGIPGSFYFHQTMENARDFSADPLPKCSGIELYDCSNVYLAPGKTSENGTVNYIDFSNATISIS